MNYALFSIHHFYDLSLQCDYKVVTVVKLKFPKQGAQGKF